MTFWWLIWRFFAITLVMGIVAMIWLYFRAMRYIWSDEITSEFKSPETIQEISKIDDFFSGSYLRYTPSEWFTTNKTGVLYKDGESVIEVNLDWDANRRYNSEKNWVWITNKYIYVDSNNGRSQSISWDKIMNWLLTWDTWISNIYIDAIFTGTNIISGDTLYIDSQNSAKLTQNIISSSQDPKFRLNVRSDISTIAKILSIPLFIAFIFLAIIFLIIYIFIFLTYVLIAWLVWSIMWSINSFSKATSVARIPFIIKEILQISFGLEFRLSIVIFVLIIIAICYKSKNTEIIKE